MPDCCLWSPPARDPFDSAREGRLDGSPLSSSVSMLPRRLRFWLGWYAAVPGVPLCIPPSSASSRCLLPRTCAGGADEDGRGVVVSREPESGRTERRDTAGCGLWACSGGGCGGAAVAVEDAGGGWAAVGVSGADGIEIEASLGVWSATATEFGSAGPMSVPADDD